MSSSVVPIYVRWFIDALVSTRNTIIVILTVLELAITSNHLYRGQESLKGLITSETQQIWATLSNGPTTTAAFSAAKNSTDISVTWYIRHWFAIGWEKSRGIDVCNVAHKYANRAAVCLPTSSSKQQSVVLLGFSCSHGIISSLTSLIASAAVSVNDKQRCKLQSNSCTARPKKFQRALYRNPLRLGVGTSNSRYFEMLVFLCNDYSLPVTVYAMKWCMPDETCMFFDAGRSSAMVNTEFTRSKCLRRLRGPFLTAWPRNFHRFVYTFINSLGMQCDLCLQIVSIIYLARPSCVVSPLWLAYAGMLRLAPLGLFWALGLCHGTGHCSSSTVYDNLRGNKLQIRGICCSIPQKDPAVVQWIHRPSTPSMKDSSRLGAGPVARPREAEGVWTHPLLASRAIWGSCAEPTRNLISG